MHTIQSVSLAKHIWVQVLCNLSVDEFSVVKTGCVFLLSGCDLIQTFLYYPFEVLLCQGQMGAADESGFDPSLHDRPQALN